MSAADQLSRNTLFLNLILLAGSPGEKLAAAAAAGFDAVELWAGDVGEAGAPAIRAALDGSGLGLADLQVLADFDGAAGDARVTARSRATAMLDQAAAIGAPMVLAPASTAREIDGDRIVEDLAWLSAAAAMRGLRVAYEPMAWSTVNPTIPAAWEAVRRVGAANLGLVIDAYHLYVQGRSSADLAGIPAEHVFLVQFSDCDHAVRPEDYKHVARHERCLPGDGQFPLAGLAAALKDMAYAGPVGLEVFNDRLKAAPAGQVARRAKASLDRLWPRSTVREMQA